MYIDRLCELFSRVTADTNDGNITYSYEYFIVHTRRNRNLFYSCVTPSTTAARFVFNPSVYDTIPTLMTN